MRTPPAQQLIAFLALTLGLSIPLEYLILTRIHTVHSFAAIGLNWLPGVVAIILANVYKNTSKPEKYDLALWQPALRYLILGYAVPALAALLILAFSSVMGLGELQFQWTHTTVNRAVFAPTLGVLVAVVVAAGEEFGWRGFMHIRLSEMDFRYPHILTGAIWAIWHWPLILFGDFSAARLPLVAVFLYTVMLVSFSLFLGQLRSASRSVWPCVLANAAHNTWIREIYPHFLKNGAIDPFFGGETGILLALIYLTLALGLSLHPIE